MNEIITSIKEFLASIYFDRWYAVFMSVTVSLASELLLSLFWLKKSYYRSGSIREKNDGPSMIANILWYAVVCCGLFAVCTFIYSIARNGWNLRLYPSQFKAFIKQYWITMIVIPVVVKVASNAITLKSKWLKLSCIIVLVILMLAAPAFLTFPNRQIAIEALLLEQFQKLPYPYVTKLYDNTSVWNDMSSPTDESNSSSEQESLPDGSIDGLSIDQLMEKAQLCWDRDGGLLKKYTDAAYQSYSSGGTGSPFNIGLMWYYMGKIYENDGYYATSGQVYEEDIQYLNASKAYRMAYIVKNEYAYAQKTMQTFYYATSDSLPQSDFFYIEWFICYLQNTYASDEVPYLHELCELFPDNKLFNIIQITRHIRTGTENENDLEIINKLLNRDGFSEYPKLLLMQAYYQNLYGKQYDTAKIYNLYNNGANFYPEDQMNLAWLLYTNGEYGKAYKIATDAYKNSNNDALLVLCEILLRDESTLSIDKRKLLDELTTISTEWYNDDSQLRFQLLTLLLTKKVGMSIDVSEIASKSLSLFAGNEFADKLIQATVAFEEHDYNLCKDLCGQMLELDLTGKDKHRILFLKTEALLALAKEDPDNKESYLTEAKEAMEVVQNDVEDDYVNCLKKLRDIYEMSGDDESRNEITNRLLQFN